MSNMANKKAWLILVLLAAAFIVLHLPLLNKEYVPESDIWITAGNSIAHVGYPYYHLPNDTFIPWDQPKGPMFAFLLGGGYALFGEHEWVTRSVPTLFAFAQVFLLVLLARGLFKERGGWLIGMIAASFVVFHPYFLQGSTQTEVDVIAGFFSLLVLFFGWRIYERGGRYVLNYASFSLAVMFLFLNRFETAPLLAALVAFFFLIKRGLVPGLTVLALAGLGIIMGATLMVSYAVVSGHSESALAPFLSALIYAHGPGAPASAATVDRIFQVFHLAPGSPLFPFLKPIFPFAALAVVAFTWLTIPLAFLIVFSLLVMWKNRKDLDDAMIFMILPGILILLALSLVTYQLLVFQRYFDGALLMLVTGIIAFHIKNWKLSGLSFRLNQPRIMAIVAAVFIATVLFATTPLSIFLADDRIISPPLRVGMMLAATILGAMFAAWRAKNRRTIAYIFAASICLVAVFTLATDIRDYAKPYALTSYYGNYGFKDAGEYLKKNVKPGQVIVASDIIGYYYGGPFYAASDYAASEKQFAAVNPDWVAVYRVPPKPTDEFIKENGKRILAARFGTVEVYKKP